MHVEDAKVAHMNDEDDETREKDECVPVQAARVQVHSKLLAAPKGTRRDMAQLAAAEGTVGGRKKI